MRSAIAVLIVWTILPLAAHGFDAASVRIHGFISQGYLISDENNYFGAETEDGTFEFNDIGINFTSQLTDQLRVGAQFLSRDLGQFGNNDVELDWAFGDYRFRNWLGLRAGKMRLAAALYNQSRDIDAARTPIFLPQAIYNETWRDTQTSITGVGLYGDLPGRLRYQLQMGKIDIDDEGGVAKLFADRLGLPFDLVEIETDDEAVVANLTWDTPLPGLSAGCSYVHGLQWVNRVPALPQVPEIETELNVWLLSLEYFYDRWLLAVEYAESKSEQTAMGETVGETTAQGYYAMLSYRLSEWFELGGYASFGFPDKDDRDGDGFKAIGEPEEKAWMRDYALTARFDINEYWIVKLEGHYLDGLANVEPAGDDLDPDGFLLAIRTTFTF